MYEDILTSVKMSHNTFLQPLHPLSPFEQFIIFLKQWFLFNIFQELKMFDGILI